MVSAPPKAATLMFSTPLTSILTLPTSRDSVTRPPLAEMSMTLVGAVAVELKRIFACPTLHDITAVAGVPDEQVVAGPAEKLVVAFAAYERVIARVTEKLICARAAGQHVVARAAGQFGGGQCAIGLVERDRVVAGLAGHLDLGGVGNRCLAAVDGYGATVHENVSSRVAAGGDGIADAVAVH